MPALYNRIRDEFTETLTASYLPAPAPARAPSPAPNFTHLTPLGHQRPEEEHSYRISILRYHYFGVFQTSDQFFGRF